MEEKVQDKKEIVGSLAEPTHKKFGTEKNLIEIRKSILFNYSLFLGAYHGCKFYQMEILKKEYEKN